MTTPTWWEELEEGQGPPDGSDCDHWASVYEELIRSIEGLLHDHFDDPVARARVKAHLRDAKERWRYWSLLAEEASFPAAVSGQQGRAAPGA